MLLGPSQIHQDCSAYLAGKPIGGVPLDPREGGTTVLGKHLDAWECQISGRRHPLLCNHGARGTGKTVQLAISGSEFLKRRPDGFVVYLTFNDDYFSEL